MACVDWVNTLSVGWGSIPPMSYYYQGNQNRKGKVMPGCMKDAKRVARGKFKKLDAERVSTTEGNDDCTRTVYRVGSVVYKVNGHTPDNAAEFQILTDLSHHEWAPPVSLFDTGEHVILCMPYYPDLREHFGVPRDTLDEIRNALEGWMADHGMEFPNADLHSGNYRVVGPGQVMVIDAAGTYPHQEYLASIGKG